MRGATPAPKPPAPNPLDLDSPRPTPLADTAALTWLIAETFEPEKSAGSSFLDEVRAGQVACGSRVLLLLLAAARARARARARTRACARAHAPSATPSVRGG